jgi:hypothetical protein
MAAKQVSKRIWISRQKNMAFQGWLAKVAYYQSGVNIFWKISSICPDFSFSTLFKLIFVKFQLKLCKIFGLFNNQFITENPRKFVENLINPNRRSNHTNKSSRHDGWVHRQRFIQIQPSLQKKLLTNSMINAIGFNFPHYDGRKKIINEKIINIQ